MKICNQEFPAKLEASSGSLQALVVGALAWSRPGGSQVEVDVVLLPWQLVAFVVGLSFSQGDAKAACTLRLSGVENFTVNG